MSNTWLCFSADRQPLAMPAPDGLVPPHRPLPARQPVHWLEVHHCPESFDVVHRKREKCSATAQPVNGRTGRQIEYALTAQAQETKARRPCQIPLPAISNSRYGPVTPRRVPSPGVPISSIMRTAGPPCCNLCIPGIL